MTVYRDIPKRYRPRITSDFAKDVAAWISLIVAAAIITAKVIMG